MLTVSLTEVFSRTRGYASLVIALLITSCPSFGIDNPGEPLTRKFQAAKTSLAAHNLIEADRYYREAIAFGLRQLGNLSLSQNKFDQATQYFDDAYKLTPQDDSLQVEAAVAWFRKGDSKKAKSIIEEVLAKDPQMARAHNVLGRLLLFEGNGKQALVELKAAVSLQDDFETSYFLAIALLKAKDQSEAGEVFKKIEAKTGDSAALRVLFGRAYLVTHFPGPAMDEFRKAIALDSKYPRAHSLLGYSTLEFFGESGYPDARKLFEQELVIQPKDYLTLVLLGITTVSLRDYATAESALLRASHIRSEDASAYLYLGETYTATKRYGAAVTILEKYVSLVHNPEEFHRDLSRGYFLLGQNLLRVGKQEQAQKVLARSRQLREAEFKYDQEHMFYDQEHQVNASDNTATESHTSERIEGMLGVGASEDDQAGSMAQGGLPPEGPIQRAPAQAAETSAAKRYRQFVSEVLGSSYNDLGVMRAQESDFANAAGYFKQAAAWQPTLPGLDRNWGLAAYRAQLYSEATAPLERQLKAHPEDSVVRRLLGVTYFAADNFQKTVEVLTPFLNDPPADPALLFAWGTALVRTKQAAAGQQIFKLLLENNADNPSIHFLLGQAQAQQEDYVSAQREFESCLRLDPKFSEAHYYMGLVDLHQSNFESAIREFREELELRPADTTTSYHLAFALRSSGQTGEATQILRALVAAKPDYEPAYFELGRALLEQGEAAAAINSLEAAKELNPNREATYFQLSQAHRKLGHIQEADGALAIYRKLIEEARLKKRKSFESNDGILN